MKKNRFIKIMVWGIALLCGVCITFLHNDANASGGQTIVGHVNADGSATLYVATSTLESAFETDVNYDSISDYHNATFDSVFIAPILSGGYQLDGFGSNANFSHFCRGFVLTEDGKNDLTVASIGSRAPGNCSGCDGCKDDGAGGCGSCGEAESGCTNSGVVANSLPGGYIGDFY